MKKYRSRQNASGSRQPWRILGPPRLYGGAAALFLVGFFCAALSSTKNFQSRLTHFFNCSMDSQSVDWSAFLGTLAHDFKSFALIVAVDLAAIGWGSLIVPLEQPLRRVCWNVFYCVLGMGLGQFFR